MNSDQNTNLSEMEIDAIGEIMNISLGSSVTSVSTMLDKRVNITTPVVELTKVENFMFESYEPAVGVEINYTEGLVGTNVMILKESDIKIIVGLLLGIDYSNQKFEMDEMNTSAVCEVMNQMMGASATALSQFLGYSVSISTPNSFPILDRTEFKNTYFQNQQETIVAVKFIFKVEDLINSEFINVINLDLAKKMIQPFVNIPEPEQPQQKEQTSQTAETKISQPAMDGPQKVNAIPKKASRTTEPPIQHQIEKTNFTSFDEEQTLLSAAQANNLNLIMSVPLQITVEIGRTKRKVKEILEMAPGTIIELNRQAASQVDIFVNNQVVAKGDVVIVDDYYGVRVTDVLSDEDILNSIL